MEFDDCLKRVWLDLLYQHRQAAKDKDEPRRERIFNMINTLEAVYPQLSNWNV